MLILYVVENEILRTRKQSGMRKKVYARLLGGVVKEILLQNRKKIPTKNGFNLK